MKRSQLSAWQGKIALVTGASSGIGAATAKKLAAQGLQVVLAARRADRLAALAEDIQRGGGHAEIVPADLSREADRARLLDVMVARWGGVDVLVNNAGLGWYGYAADMPWQTAWEMLQVNVDAVVQLSISLLKAMRQRNAGHIINIGSISGSLPSQGVALYGATKSFLDAFTTALHREMAGTRVRLSVVRAGPVLTEFCETAASRHAGRRLPTERMGVTAEAVAERVWELLKRPRRVIYIPRWLALTPLVETYCGWIIDRLGPLLLRRSSPSAGG